MNTNNQEENRPQRQTSENPSGDAVINPFENGQPAEKDIEVSKEAMDKEQQFKEAQTERD
ncbi:MAG: hypothetical protein JWR72_2602 [Flavisolibacter sp.]|jgi:hypothetical protein|nr:hypothetical protein [Flavisolibacter sp.]